MDCVYNLPSYGGVAGEGWLGGCCGSGSVGGPGGYRRVGGGRRGVRLLLGLRQRCL